MKTSEYTLLETMVPVFVTHGVRAPSMANIARACGMNLRELKEYFPTKKTLVYGFVNHLLVRRITYLAMNPDMSETAETELRNFFSLIEELAAELTPSMLLELKKYCPEGWRRLNDFRERYLVPHLVQNLKRGLAENAYREDLDLRVFVTMYFQLLYAIITEYRCPYGTSTTLLRHLHKVVQRGVLRTGQCELAYNASALAS